jgi:NAD(P)-dependent dehydrogenase (short-subunit alcohol dehydrogenase family)
VSSPRVVIVTGGTFGIGRAITLRLSALGHAVVAFGLEAPQISSTAAAAIPGLASESKERGLHAHLMEADVSNPGDVAKVVETTLQRHGRIDALVNNAAIGPLGTVLDTDEATFDRIMAVNLKGRSVQPRRAAAHDPQWWRRDRQCRLRRRLGQAQHGRLLRQQGRRVRAQCGDGL